MQKFLSAISFTKPNYKERVIDTHSFSNNTTDDNNTTVESRKRLPSNLILLGRNVQHNSHFTTSKNPKILLLPKIRKWQVVDGDVFL